MKTQDKIITDHGREIDLNDNYRERPLFIPGIFLRIEIFKISY